ncbi:MAG: M20/M25/M40 family metallo-hydrolase [Pyrinomonadaceae bacterium]|nr:M20/M25/M40 family metallo-hydrolase [Pyrinomonadaceae bacterium]
MKQMSGFARRGSSITSIRGVESSGGFASLYLIAEADAESLESVTNGSDVAINSEVADSSTSYTWNAVGKIKGNGDDSEAILLSAHMDHVGVRENAPGDDKIFNGADDDASGCVAVLELARIIAAGEKPRRTIYFAFFGSEERGGFGSRFFVNTLEIPLEKLVANLQFEMIGRPDPKVGPDELWLTGYKRSDLGSELAKTGAKIVADPHPEENFFQRSDNITLARRGVVAHTVSSFGLHKDYHQASDEIETIDFEYMTKSISSMVKPVRWLADTTWKPSWNEGMKP